MCKDTHERTCHRRTMLHIMHSFACYLPLFTPQLFFKLTHVLSLSTFIYKFSKLLYYLQFSLIQKLKLIHSYINKNTNKF